MSADQVEAVKSGYAFGTPALDLGALVVDGGSADSSAPVAWLRAPQSLMAEMLLSRLNPQATTAEQGSYPQGGPQAPHKAATKAAKEEPGMVEQVLKSRTTQTLIKSAAAAAGAAIVRSIFGTARRSKK